MSSFHTGQRNFESGLAAEAIAARAYLEQGFAVTEERWRGGAGEVDLILERDSELVFVEVKSSRTHDRAAGLMSRAQMARVSAAAEEYLLKSGRFFEATARIDLALVDGTGRSRVIENITMN